MNRWSGNLDRVIRGDARNMREIVLCKTPGVLVAAGLPALTLIMTPGKVATARREHPDVPLDVWRRLPQLLADPLAIFPSARDDGTVIVAVDAVDSNACPVIVPVTPDGACRRNVVLSVYGKEATGRRSGQDWIKAEIAAAKTQNRYVYEKKGFVGSVPKPGTIAPSSSGLIPVDGPTKPNRQILTLRQKVKDATPNDDLPAERAVDRDTPSRQ